ncbi:MAG: hypothetical protein ACOYMG_13465 [Candidatus Methylumidiphilus sp.]
MTDKAQSQTWVGVYADGGKKISGNYTGVGGPGPWTAEVVTPPPPAAPAAKPVPPKKTPK